MTVRIAFLRHGHTSWNRAHRIQGSTDIPLDDQARKDLSALKLPPPWDTANLWSSPLARAVETAKIVGGEPQQSKALTEMDWGHWEGQRGLDLKSDTSSGFKDLEDWGWDYRPPNGESPGDVRARIEPWLNARTRDTVVVAHMGVMRVAIALATGWNLMGPCPFSIKRNRLFVIEKTQGGWISETTPVRLVPRE